MKYIIYIFAILSIGCEKDKPTPPLCISEDCNAQLTLDYPQDKNGFYHVELDFTKAYLEGSWPTFEVFVEADKVYTEDGLVKSTFDSDTWWKTNNTIFTIPEYVPWSSYSQYEKDAVCVVGYENEVELSPLDGENVRKVYARHEIGSFPSTYENDTITVYSKVMWMDYKEIDTQNNLMVKVIIERK